MMYVEGIIHYRLVLPRVAVAVVAAWKLTILTIALHGAVV